MIDRVAGETCSHREGILTSYAIVRTRDLNELEAELKAEQFRTKEQIRDKHRILGEYKEEVARLTHVIKGLEACQNSKPKNSASTGGLWGMRTSAPTDPTIGNPGTTPPMRTSGDSADSTDTRTTSASTAHSGLTKNRYNEDNQHFRKGERAMNMINLEEMIEEATDGCVFFHSIVAIPGTDPIDVATITFEPEQVGDYPKLKKIIDGLAVLFDRPVELCFFQNPIVYRAEK